MSTWKERADKKREEWLGDPLMKESLSDYMYNAGYQDALESAKVLVEALEFYAESMNYHFADEPYPEVMTEEGLIAKQALEKWREGEK